MEPLFLTLDEALEIHALQTELYGAQRAFAMWAAWHRPWQIGGGYAHGHFRRRIPALDNSLMPAAYLFHICQNHPFFDGNKRTGANAAVTFVLMNDWESPFTEEELIILVLEVASGTMSRPTLADVFGQRCRPVARSL